MQLFGRVLYEFLAALLRLISRKHHPNGILSYGLSSYADVIKLPILLDVEPCVPLSKFSGRQSALRLVDRLIAAFPGLQLHIVIYSLFGSVSDVHSSLYTHIIRKLFA